MVGAKTKKKQIVDEFILFSPHTNTDTHTHFTHYFDPASHPTTTDKNTHTYLYDTRNNIIKPEVAVFPQLPRSKAKSQGTSAVIYVV